MIRGLIYSVIGLSAIMVMAELELITLNHEWLKQAHQLCSTAVEKLISIL